METKLIAAEIATGAGVSVVIMSSKRAASMLDIIRFNAQTLPLPRPLPNNQNGSVPSTLPHVVSSTSASGTSTPVRPPHTLFRPSTTPLTDLKSWTAHTLSPAGSVVVDEGAHKVLSRRDSGGRLLAVGVIAVVGSFAAGQAVRIVIRKPKPGAKATVKTTVEVTDGDQSYTHSTEDSTTITSESPASLLVPDSPQLNPLHSLASSMSSMDPLSRVASISNIYEAMKPSQSAPLPLGAIGEEGPNTPGEKGYKFFTSSADDNKPEDQESWDVVEVGRGLANYNSAEILKVRGAKR